MIIVSRLELLPGGLVIKLLVLDLNVKQIKGTCINHPVVNSVHFEGSTNHIAAGNIDKSYHLHITSLVANFTSVFVV